MMLSYPTSTITVCLSSEDDTTRIMSVLERVIGKVACERGGWQSSRGGKDIKVVCDNLGN